MKTLTTALGLLVSTGLALMNAVFWDGSHVNYVILLWFRRDIMLSSWYKFFYPENGDHKSLRNRGKCLAEYTAFPAQYSSLASVFGKTVIRK